MEQRIIIEKVEYHRNGCSGEGFHVVNFIDAGENAGECRRMVGVVFPAEGHVAVFDRDLLGQGEIRFCYNSWRGDYYEEDLRCAVEEYRDNLFGGK